MVDSASCQPPRGSVPVDLAAQRRWRRQLRTPRLGWTLGAAAAFVVLLLGVALPASASRSPAVKPTVPRASVPAVLPGSDDTEPRARGPGGARLVEQYAKLDPEDEPARHRFVLEQIAAGNLPSSWNRWVTVQVRGQFGTRVEFDVSPHGLRIGSDADWVEIPLDGPHFAAAAELLGCRLSTAWMVEQTCQQARRSGTVVHFFAAAEIAQSLGWHDWQNNSPDGLKMKGATFFRQRSSLLRHWLDEHHVASGDLVVGYFKDVVSPVDGLTRPRGLEIVGGRDDSGREIQPLSGGLHHTRFFDYSHNVRLVRDPIRVDGKSLTLDEFFTQVGYAREFTFRYTAVSERPYHYPPALARWMVEHAPQRTGARVTPER